MYCQRFSALTFLHGEIQGSGKNLAVWTETLFKNTKHYGINSKVLTNKSITLANGVSKIFQPKFRLRYNVRVCSKRR